LLRGRLADDHFLILVSSDVEYPMIAFHFLPDTVYIEEMPNNNFTKKRYTNVGDIQDNFEELSSDSREKNGNR
jgi:hypothetical protein